MAEINNNTATPVSSQMAQAHAMNSAPADSSLATDAINTAQNDLAAARIPDALFKNKAVEDKPVIKTNDSRLPFLTGKAQSAVSYIELFTALPLLLSSLISQAETIVGEEKNHSDSLLMNFLTTSVKSLSSIFSWGFHQFVPKTSDPNDVTINRHPFLFDNFLGRISQPVFVKEATSFIFAMRRALFAFIPNVLTVPAEEHDPTKPKGDTASGFATNILRASSSLLSPFRVVSSLLTSVFALPSNALGAFFAYTGDQKPFNLTKFTSQISDYLLPVTTNLNSLYKVTKAYKDSWSSKNMHLGLAFDRYNINSAHVIQGVLGSIISIPYFFGAMLKVRNILLEPDMNDTKKFKLANLARDFVGAMPMEIVSLTGANIATAQTWVHSSITRFLEYIDDYSNQSLVKLMNSTPIVKSFFSKFRPTDISGNVLSSNHSEAVGSGNMKNDYVFNRFKKSEFFSEIFDLLHPIQSALMLLPNAFVSMSDAYVQDNGTKYLRRLDRLVGVNSMVLSLPNYLIYFFKTRVPQVILKWYEMKQRKADVEGRDYNAYGEFNKLIEIFVNAKLPGSTYFAKILQSLDIKAGDFYNDLSIKLKMEKLEKVAKEHEHSVKASELVTAMRIGMRHIISTGSPIFFANRDPETGFTAEEQAKDSAYKSIGKFTEVIKGIPIVGWFAAPIVDTFRSIYKVTPNENRKKLQIGGKQMAA